MTPYGTTVWLADTTSAGRFRLDLLNAVERGRLDRLAMAADQDRFVVAAALLRTVVGELLGTDARSVEVDRTCDGCGGPHGRPLLPGSGLHASISHSEGVVAVAVSDHAPVGVDVEHLAPRDTTGLARAMLGPGEHATGAWDFYTYWCRKEAVVKATGSGLRTPLVDVLVTPPGAPARVRSYRGTPLVCRLADLSIPELRGLTGHGPMHYAAAVAVLADRELHLRMVRADDDLFSAAA